MPYYTHSDSHADNVDNNFITSGIFRVPLSVTKMIGNMDRMVEMTSLFMAMDISASDYSKKKKKKTNASKWLQSIFVASKTIFTSARFIQAPYRMCILYARVDQNLTSKMT